MLVLFTCCACPYLYRSRVHVCMHEARAGKAHAKWHDVT